MSKRKHSISAWFETAMFILCALGFTIAYTHNKTPDMISYGFIGAVWFRCAETSWKRRR